MNSGGGGGGGGSSVNGVKWSGKQHIVVYSNNAMFTKQLKVSIVKCDSIVPHWFIVDYKSFKIDCTNTAAHIGMAHR